MVDTTDLKLLEIRARYKDLVDRAASAGFDLLNALDPAAISCDTGTRCCAGDNKVLDARELAINPTVVALEQNR